MIQPTAILFLLAAAVLLLTRCETKPPTAAAAERYSYQHPIPFDPAQYVCYRTPDPLTIDGRLTEAAWRQAPPTGTFVDIEGALRPAPKHETRAWMLWDDDYFYVAARLDEPHLWATLTERDAVIFQDDDFEVFIDPDGDGHNYYEFEINALNTVWDLLLLRPYRVDGRAKVLDNWDINGLRSGVHLAGSLNDPSDTDEYWTVEIAFPWSALGELADTPTPPRDGDQWRVGFSRVDWEMDIVDGTYRKRLGENGKPLPESNWVWSPQGRVAMHQPETWGYVQFATTAVGTDPVAFRPDPAEAVKWALWQLHYQQVAYRKGEGAYAQRIEQLVLPEVAIEDYTFAPRLENYTGGYRLVAPGLRDSTEWIIDETARIWRR